MNLVGLKLHEGLCAYVSENPVKIEGDASNDNKSFFHFDKT